MVPALILAVLLVLLCAVSCVKMEDGEASVVVPVSFVFEGENLSGGGDNAYIVKSVDEKFIRDINIYVVNEVGAVVSHGYFTNLSKAAVTIYEGVKVKLYAVANFGFSLPLASEDEIIVLKGEGGNEGTFIMGGQLPLQDLSGKGNIVVPLVRANAKITIKADYSGLDEGVSVVIDKVSLCNTPRMVSIFGKNRLVDASEAIEGESRAGLSRGELEMGISFYQFENLQGELLEGNVMQSLKVWPQGSLYASLCSYVELRGRYSSAVKEGEICYRFYLGSNMCSNFDVRRNTHYCLTVKFMADGAIDENSWRVDVSGLEDVVPPQVSFTSSVKELYNGEESVLGFSVIDTRGKQLEVISSDPACVKVLGVDDSGVRLCGLEPGKAVVTARVGDVSASCEVVVEKLRIVPLAGSVVLYNHFYEDISYSIYPPHAASLGVELKSSSLNLVTGYTGVAGRVIPQYSSSEGFPKSEKLYLGIVGRSDACAEIDVTVMPILQVAGSIVANANMGSHAAVKSLGIQAAPRAKLQYSWLPANGISLKGDPGEYAIVSLEDNKITFPIPNGANGEYRLQIKVVGDDGYGLNEVLHTDAVQYCNITVYETIYLVGVSKSHSRVKIDVDPDKWLYENEVVAKWLSHPNSLLFPEGELSLGLNFVYEGKEYDSSHTEFVEEFTFEFSEGEQFKLEPEGQSFIYRGTAPKSYFAYFYLQPAVSPYISGSVVDGTPYLYIYSRNFASGFSSTQAPNWTRIFEYVYP